ncbi:MAG: LemA family protein [Acidobacteriota bacterium]|nr:LemA family protein [Acidobacteriota bacterium]MDQ2977691.1 LemA family protein [Acidobacteriota bacterium]
MGKIGLGCLALVVLLVVIIGVSIAGTNNRLVTLSQEVDKQWAQVENQYQRRADLVPNLVATVQGAAQFEKSTLEEVVRARASVGQAQVTPGKAPDDPAQLAKFEQAQAALGGALSRLLVVVERYPELKANANFRDLQAQLEGTENRIAVERMRFNETAQAYNTTLMKFPTNITGRLLGFKVKPYFHGTPGSERPPAVNFNFGATPVPATAPAR